MKLFKRETRSSRFNTGETVRVKSREEIKGSFGPEANALDGCLFTEQMQGYCGHTYKVLKVVRNIFNEHLQRTFTAKPAFYILENLICNGETDEFPHKCDHSCFLLWHENWLEKIE